MGGSGAFNERTLQWLILFILTILSILLNCRSIRSICSSQDFARRQNC